MAPYAMKNTSEERKEDKALMRHRIICFIQENRDRGLPLSHCLRLARQKDWQGRKYAVSTMEQWYYRYRGQGFAALKPRGRSDRGKARALSAGQIHAIEQLRRGHPQLTVRTLVRQLVASGQLQAGSFSMTSVYRCLRALGLDPRSQRLGQELAPGHGPRKAFESDLANDLWMTDMMYGPTLRGTNGRPVHTRLFAIIDDCSRLCTGARYFSGEGTACLLQVLHEAVLRRGIPRRLYADNGKAFSSRHLNVVCANLNIHLLHAKPYHSWSKGKVERFLRTVQTDFQQSLAFNPVHSLDELNAALQTWLEQCYHRNGHSALGNDNPAQRFQQRSVRLRCVNDAVELQTLFLHKVTRRVRKDATLSLDGRLWEVSPALRAASVEVRYDPVAFSRVEIYFEGRFHCSANALDKHTNARINAPGTHDQQPNRRK